MYSKIQNVKKIAVLRANALGDYIFSLPALTALRETYPRAEIVYLGQPWHQTFLENRPGPIDRVITIPKSQGVFDMQPYDSKQILKVFFTEMQRENFDIAIQLHGGGKHSNPFVNNLGARLTIGAKTDDADQTDLWIPYIYYQRETLRLLEIVSLVGAKTAHISPVLHINQKDVDEAKMALGESKQPYVILHPGASDPRRRWSAKRFARIGNYLVQKGFKILVTGSGNEKEVVENVLSSMREPAENFYEKVSLNGLLGLISLAELLISNDTGPLHVAEAVSTKSLGLFWCGNGINGAPMTRALHRPLFSWITHCPLCGQHVAKNTAFERSEKSCQHLTSFIDEIEVDEVIQATENLLAQKITSNPVVKGGAIAN